ncbi:MAG: hypothetical protein H6741_26210 [Alphaproteobacteria bacterium]|nr:hypothetical protein [Alphaproteobacteria bacterium]
MPRASVTERRRGAQAAVETMMMAFLVTVVLVAMYHLFTVTWASQNAHLRAREMILHGDAYLSGVRTNYVEQRSTYLPFDTDPGVLNYKLAAPGGSLNFRTRAWDTTRDDLIGSQSIEAYAYIRD